MSLRGRTVDAVFGAVQLAVSLYDLIRKLRKPPPPPEPIPLTRRSTTIRPPPLPTDGRKVPPQRR